MEQTAFLKIISDHQKIIHKVCRMYRNTDEDRKDLFQEIVFQLWRSYPGFKGESKVSSWIYRIALNTAISVFRKPGPLINYTESLPDYSENEVSQDQEEAMFAALKKLSESERALIALFLEDYSYQEIAAITGITENYVGVKISRIKEKLKTILIK